MVRKTENSNKDMLNLLRVTSWRRVELELNAISNAYFLDDSVSQEIKDRFEKLRDTFVEQIENEDLISG